MSISRDSLVWTLGILSGIVGVIAAQADAFPAAWKPYITVIGALLGVISAKLATSPLPGERKF